MSLTLMKEAPAVFTIADDRSMDVPKDLLLGVENDEKVNELRFSMPKIVNGVDFSSPNAAIYVSYINADNKSDKYLVQNAEVKGDRIEFSWILSRKVTNKTGTVAFNINAIINDPMTSEILHQFDSAIAVAVVLKGIDVIVEPDDPCLDIINQLVIELKKQTAVNQNPPKIINGTWYVWNTETGAYENSGISAEGTPGEPGLPGKTPVRGVDYWTAEDIATIDAHIDATIGVVTNAEY